MRDKNRIQPMMETIAKLWEKYPDLRFSQIMYDFLHRYENPYFLEDDKFIEEFEDYFNQLNDETAATVGFNEARVEYNPAMVQYGWINIPNGLVEGEIRDYVIDHWTEIDFDEPEEYETSREDLCFAVYIDGKECE